MLSFDFVFLWQILRYWMYHHQHEVVAALTLWRHFVRRSVDFSALPYRLLQGKAHSNATLLMAVVPCALGMAHVVWGAGGGLTRRWR